MVEGKKKSVDSTDSSGQGAAEYPDMKLAQKIHRLSNTTDGDNMEFQALVMEEIASIENPSLYCSVQSLLYDGGVTNISSAKLTADDLKVMTDKHDNEMLDLEKSCEEAKESAGEMEVLDSKLNMARLAAQKGSKTQSLARYQEILDLPKLSRGKQMDVYMEQARLASFYNDTEATHHAIDAAEKLVADGGDWDRRNRLQVYRALQHLLHRNIEAASKLFLDGMATFQCTEMCTYAEFLVYATLTNMLYLPRQQLEKKIVNSPEILSVAKQIPIVLKLVRSLYDCEYHTYLHAIVEVEDILLKDRFLHPHVAYWMRELHLLAYKQFLDAYQSVTLDAMARAFGVSVDFIDWHASRFIASNRLCAKIDKYGGVIVTNRPDLKNAQYREMIQKGDLLLNRIQKLARVVDL